MARSPLFLTDVFLRDVDRRLARRRRTRRRVLWLALLTIGWAGGAFAGVTGPLGVSLFEAEPNRAPPPVRAPTAVPVAPPVAPPMPSLCPAGYRLLGEFEVTGYALAEEVRGEATETVTDPCGLSGTFARDFLYGGGVKRQGSGRAADGRFVRYDGGDCFAVQACPTTASGTCAEEGRTVAVDSSVIPLGSRVFIEGFGFRTAEDRGGRVRGKTVDVYFGARGGIERALQFGRERREVCVAD